MHTQKALRPEQINCSNCYRIRCALLWFVGMKSLYVSLQESRIGRVTLSLVCDVLTLSKHWDPTSLLIERE